MLPTTVFLDAFSGELQLLEACHFLATTNKEYWEAYTEQREIIYRRLIARSWRTTVPEHLVFFTLRNIVKYLLKNDLMSSVVVGNDTDLFVKMVELKVIPAKPDGSLAVLILANIFQTVAVHDCEEILLVLPNYYPQNPDANGKKLLETMGLTEDALLQKLRNKEALRCLKVLGKPLKIKLTDTGLPYHQMRGVMEGKIYKMPEPGPPDLFHCYCHGQFDTVTSAALLPGEDLQEFLRKQPRVKTLEKLLDLFLTPYGPLVFGEVKQEWPLSYVGMISAIMERLLNQDNYKDYYWKLLYLGALNSTILYDLKSKFPLSFTPARIKKALPVFVRHGVMLAMEVSVFTQLVEDHEVNLRMPIKRFFQGLVQQKLVELPWLEDLLSKVDE